MSEIKLSENKVKELVQICESFGNQPGELINILHKAQDKFGYLPREVQEIIARQLSIPVSKVYGVVTFYSFFTMTPKGEHPISVCMGTACYVRGAEKVLDEFKRVLGINVGETTADGKYSLTSSVASVHAVWRRLYSSAKKYSAVSFPGMSKKS